MRKPHARHKHRERIHPVYVVLGVFVVAVLLSGSMTALRHRTAASSPETHFTDSSRSGLQIMPASGGSLPSGCGDNTLNDECPCSLPWGGTTAYNTSVTAYSAPTVPYGSTCASISQTRSCGANSVLSGSYTYGSCSVQNCSSPPPAAPGSTGGYSLSAGYQHGLINLFSYNFCVSNTGSNTYFIPTKTATELQSFYNAIPRLTGVSQYAQ